MTRWRFPDPSEEAERAAILAKIDAWWRAFAGYADALDAYFESRRLEDKKQEELVDFMAEHLEAIEDGLCWEYGPALHKEGHRLVISPEWKHELRPLVDDLLRRAPQLPRWEFYPYRVPEKVPRMLATVQARCDVDFSGTLVRVISGEDSRLNLEFHCPACSDPEDEQTDQAGLIAAATLLGEELVMTWIGPVETVPLRPPKGGNDDSGLLPLERLRETVQARIASTVDRLPDQPWYLIDREGPHAPRWTKFELNADDQEDYPEREDLQVAVTPFADFWREAHGPWNFSSCRHSRFRETFCYLKIDNLMGLGAQFPDRGSIEDAVDAVLRPAEAGGTIGGGTGTRYLYVDLALTEVDAAIPLLRRVLRAADFPKRTWLLFFDGELAGEWVGMWDDTPPPPTPPEEPET
jgi:hypothetical protein